MTTAHLAASGFEQELDDELARAGASVVGGHGRLRLVEGPPLHAAWAANTWWNAERLPIESIGDAARQLRARQRNWCLYAPTLRGRAELVVAKLPHVAARPLELREDGFDLAPNAPLGSWTLLDRDTVLAATDCTSPFPNGEPMFVEDRHGPPSRAYLKLWEAFARLGRRPAAGERCLELGAAPGGWTWLLARTGADIRAIDRAPLASHVDAMPNVESLRGDAFARDPAVDGPVDWLCSDLIAYPERLHALLERWLDAGMVRNVICTVKLQGATDHAAAARFGTLPGAQLFHLHHNKHELTCAILDAPVAG